jgi:tRNA 2-thiouridine synthesizing protein B
MILHTLNASPTSSAFADCLRVIAAGDAIVLMGDGVYVALIGTRAWDELQAKGAKIYLLGADARAAGVTGGLAEGAKLIEMEGFVALTERYPRQQAWY